MSKNDICQECDGRGYDPNTNSQCKTCKGKGLIEQKFEKVEKKSIQYYFEESDKK